MTKRKRRDFGTWFVEEEKGNPVYIIYTDHNGEEWDPMFPATQDGRDELISIVSCKRWGRGKVMSDLFKALAYYPL